MYNFVSSTFNLLKLQLCPCPNVQVVNTFVTPFFAAVYVVEQLVLQIIQVLNKKILQFLRLKFTVYNQEGFQIKVCNGAHTVVHPRTRIK